MSDYDDGFCCTPDSGDCCGPGSWCCKRAGKHDHDDDLAVSAWSLLGSKPDFTGGMSVDEYMDEERSRGQE